MIASLESDPDAARAGLGWEGDILVVVHAEPPVLERPFAVYGRPVGGKICDFQVLDDPDEWQGVDAAYVVKARYSDWTRLVRKELDPIAAIARGAFEFEGDVQPLLERVRFKNLLRKAADAVPTVFLD